MCSVLKLVAWMLLIPGTGNGERGTGNRERESGTKCTAATLLRIQNGDQNKRKARRETIWVKVSFHRLCSQMASTFLQEQSPISTGINKACNGA